MSFERQFYTTFVLQTLQEISFRHTCWQFWHIYVRTLTHLIYGFASTNGELCIGIIRTECICHSLSVVQQNFSITEKNPVMMFLGRCRTRNEADILINVFTQVISGSSGIVQWQTIFSAFPDFYFCLSRPYHIIVNDSHAQAWVAVSVRISFHSRIIPVERCSILHFESIYQVLSRTSRSFTAFYSHREISFLEIAMLTGRTRQNNFNALVIGSTKQVREFIQLISISGN